MALEEPFSHWPFGTPSNGHQKQQSSMGQRDIFKRYDTNDSPYKGMSPIPNGGRGLRDISNGRSSVPESRAGTGHTGLEQTG